MGLYSVPLKFPRTELKKQTKKRKEKEKRKTKNKQARFFIKGNRLVFIKEKKGIIDYNFQDLESFFFDI